MSDHPEERPPLFKTTFFSETLPFLLACQWPLMDQGPPPPPFKTTFLISETFPSYMHVNDPWWSTLSAPFKKPPQWTPHPPVAGGNASCGADAGIDHSRRTSSHSQHTEWWLGWRCHRGYHRWAANTVRVCFLTPVKEEKAQNLLQYKARLSG